MKLRLFVILFVLFAMPIHAQTDAPTYAYLHVFNPSPDPISVGIPDDTRQIIPNDSATFYLPIDATLYLDEMPLTQTFTVGERYLLVYVGGDSPYVIHALRDIAEQMTIEPTDADTSVWWVANYFTDQTARLSITVNDKVVIDQLAYGEIAHFYAPITYFMFGASVGDITLFRTDQAFGEPYLTGIMVFSGDYMGRILRDYFPTAVNAVETDLLTWMTALSAAKIDPHEYDFMANFITRADMQADFLAEDRVILLPNDAAFGALPFDVRGYYLADADRLSAWMNNHLLVRSALPATDLPSITTLAGYTYEAVLGRMGLTIGDVRYITKVYLPNRSEVWLIDGVLMPPQ
jgi:hypothetical protein